MPVQIFIPLIVVLLGFISPFHVRTGGGHRLNYRCIGLITSGSLSEAAALRGSVDSSTNTDRHTLQHRRFGKDERR